MLDVALRIVPLVASLVAVALSVVALRRSGSQKPEGVVETRSTAVVPAVGRPLPPIFVAGTPLPVATPVPPRIRAGPTHSPVAAPRMNVERTAGKPPSASVAAIAAKLRVRADILATLGDASGELPAPLEARLLRAQVAAADVASRARLDDQKRDVVADILVDYVIRTLREVDPDGPPDQDRVAEIRQDALAAVRGGVGPEAEPIVGGVIDGL